MRYYEVIPATKSYHGKEPLTYCYEQNINPGQTVRIALRGKPSLGIVVGEAPKPEFKTEKVKELLDFAISDNQVSMLLWMLEYYPAPIGTMAMLFVPAFVDKLEKPGGKNSEGLFDPKALPELTDEQHKAYDLIKNTEGRGSFILHGITGSGKTRVYMELAKDSLKQGKSVIILTPEISLTAPIAKQFKEVFGSIVMVNHSSLTSKQRRDIWSKLFYNKSPAVIIGPRSSLFMPIKEPGLIIVDEFHEAAYKQESQPFYHANRVASMLSRLTSAKLIFGSATPPVIEYFFAEQKNVPIINMETSALTGKKPSPKSIIVNMLESTERSAQPLLSKTLISSISSVLARGEQAMIFINKRGSARSISCQNCGHKELCENCDLPMVYHADQHLIRCHTCGNKRQTPNKCPDCGSLNIFFSSPGTKAIADSLSKLFPQAKISRFDKDNKKADRMENKYDEVVNEADIIVGTQIIAKGHDLPRLSLVAMLLAGSGLDFPDFTSAERSYQLIKQLSGRTNRGHVEGIFLIQTFSPNSKLIESAIHGAWDEFYREEMQQRKKHGFPPFYSVLKVETSKKSRIGAERSLSDLLEKINRGTEKLIILGPSPSFIEKKASNWHWQVIMKSKVRSDLVKIAKTIPSSFKVDIDPINFL